MSTGARIPSERPSPTAAARWRARLALAAMLLVGGALPARADCTCRAAGKNFALGETVCLKTSDGPRVARCAMALNNTSWQFSEASCPLAGIAVPQTLAAVPHPHADGPDEEH